MAMAMAMALAAGPEPRLYIPPQYFLAETFHYVPNTTVNAVAVSVFGVMAIILLVETIKWRGNYMYIAPATAFFEALGYGLRIYTADNLDLNGFIVCSLFLLIAPIAIALINYIVVGRILDAIGKPFWFLQPRHISRLFFASDVITFIIQATGGGMLAIDDTQVQNIGRIIIIAGLSIQVLFFTFFIIIFVTMSVADRYYIKWVPAITPVLWCLGITTGMLYIRNIYRLLEYSVNSDSVLVTYEWVFNAFETIPILITFILFSILHYGRLLGEANPEQAEWRKQLAVVKEDKGVVNSASRHDSLTATAVELLAMSSTGSTAHLQAAQ